MSTVGVVSSERKYLMAGGMMMLVTLLLFLALVTDDFSMHDSAGLMLDGASKVSNVFGLAGATVAWCMTLIVGDAAHVVYALTFVWGILLLSRRHAENFLMRCAGLFILTSAVAALLQNNIAIGATNPQAGGAIGGFVADHLLAPTFGPIATNVIAAMLVLIGVLLTTDLLLVHGVLSFSRMTAQLTSALATGAVFRKRTPGLEARRRKLLEEEQAEEMVQIDAAVPPAPAKVQPTPKPLPVTLPEPVTSPAAAASLERMRIVTQAPAAKPVPLDMPFEAVPDIESLIEKALEEEEEVTAEEELLAPVAELEEEEEETADDFEAEETYEDELEVFDEVPVFEEEAEPEAEEEIAEIEAETPMVIIHEPAPSKPAAPVDPLLFDPAEIAPPPPRAAQPALVPVKLKPRRKTDVMDELPPDYEYPKRFTMPPIDMLDQAVPRVIENLGEQLRAIGVRLEETLRTFGIEARVTDITRGPTITRFELEPAPGTKVSRFLALADDIALSLKAHRVRVEAPIPGKGRVGIELPNQERDQVLVRELLESTAFTRGDGKIKLTLGKDIAGHVLIADLATMPHLLVAGATGAGKTVCVKALLASMLFSKSPDELQLMLIDPKMVELSIFNDIPHLITPVVTDPKKAASSLTWLINEMEERYRLFADLRVRNIEVYNQSVDNGEIEMPAAEEELVGHQVSVIRKLPYIVCVIDELADLMMLARAEVEDSIARLAQLARAVGIHLIIATQRPSVDVLTGVIKANFPARISFQVSSRVDSRCILDEIGAERLIGMGDMLYLPAGQSKPSRIQGAFVSDDEMNALIMYLKMQAPPQYRDEIENFGKSKDKMNDLLEDDDPLFEEAVQVVMETGQASISMVQRRLRVGYTRAARLIDMMELRGIVGPHTGSKAREILVATASPESR